MIGVVGEGTGAIEDVIEATGATVLVGEVDDIAQMSPDAIVAIGQSTVIDLVAAGVDAPVVAVDAGPGIPSVTAKTAEAHAERIVNGEYDVVHLPALGVTSGEISIGRALYDVMLLTSEPARISEFGVETDELITDVRADGVVIATPAGSHEYAAAAGGPEIYAVEGVAAVVPVSAFTMDDKHWVVDTETGIEVTIKRAESDVTVLVDGRERDFTGSTIHLERETTFAFGLP